MNATTTDLSAMHCRPYDKGEVPLSSNKIRELSNSIADWEVAEESGTLTRTFGFSNYHETAAFVNAVVWVAHQQDHHPDICFGYKSCHVTYSTHSVGGLSENDFICAARIDKLSV